ncbi:TPA: restriction endonuclease subunit S [Vibrio parahaemolyticus]|nr:restriction endonuclease subunit S [Vibrio parahaemolyticus]
MSDSLIGNSLITEHIDIWTSAIKAKSASGRGTSKNVELYGIKKLRELILELAVRGKLVPQDPSDEPASVLLERIAKEKAQLVKEKKIKKPKALPEITDEEKPFELPSGWEWSRLGNIITASTGFAFKTSQYVEKGIFVLRVTNINVDGTINFFDNKYISEEIASSTYSNYQLFENDLLLVMVGGSLGKIGIVSKDVLPAVLNQNMWKLNPFGEIPVYYLKHGLGYINRNLLNITASTHGHLAQGDYLNKPFPLAPLKEQHRIVAKVDELMALCDQLEQQTEASIEAHQVLVTTLLDTLTHSADADELMQNWARISEHFDTLFTTEESIDQLKQTILQLAVMGKLVSFGNSRKTMLKELLSFGPRNGLSPKEAPNRTELKVLKLGATSYGSLDLEQSKYVDVDVKDNPYLCLTRGDILIQRGNSANFVGSNVLIQEDHHNYIYPDLMMKLRVNQLISPEFLSLVLSAKTSREHMWKQMTGTSGTMPKISKKVVEGLPITFPTNKNIQAEVVSQANKLIALCDKLRTRLTDCSETKATLCDVMTQQAY